MKLTHRQKDFLGQMEVLLAENRGEPVHYSALAHSLDISNSTAYHMLRLLEDKGCVVSHYHLPKIRIGRSSLHFTLSDVGRNFL